MKPLRTHCSRCGRKLKDISARMSGMGKTCERKAAEYAERFELGLFENQVEVKNKDGIKSIGSGVSRIRIEKNHKHVRVDAAADKKRTDQAIKRAENYKRYLPKVVRWFGQSSDDQQINLGVEQS